MTKLNRILSAIKQAGGRPLFVGGFVRDAILGIPSKDIDIEVFGLDAETLIMTLKPFGKVDTVGASFGIIKLTTADNDFDFSLPRRENKTGKGHKGFIVKPDPTMTVKEAAARRDFTFNALAQDPFTDEIIDHFGGQADLKAKVIRYTSSAFSEDPLRVLRGFQFAGRFGFDGFPETLALCQLLVDEFADLAIERVWGEIWKWATKSTVPSKGLEFLRKAGWLVHFSELQALVGCPQDREWHPEGDVWQHTLHVTDQATIIARREGLSAEDTGILVLASLLHDVGKPETTVFEQRFKTPKHDKVGSAVTERFLIRLEAPKVVIAKVSEMVREHMVHVHVTKTPTKRQVKRFLARLESVSVKDVMRLIEADHSGRPPLEKGLPVQARMIQEMAEEMGNEIKPILQGRDLIAEGLKPGVHFGDILRQAFEAQMDGVFSDVTGGVEFLRREGIVS